MNIVDIVLIITLIFFAWKGYKNGLIKELASLTALIAGIFLAIRFSDFISSILSSNTGFSSEYLPIISFALIFLAVVILIFVFAGVLDKFIKAIKLQWLNKSGGIIFSILKSMLIFGGLFFFILRLNERAEIFSTSYLDKSFLFSPFIKVFEFVFPYAKCLYPTL